MEAQKDSSANLPQKAPNGKQNKTTKHGTKQTMQRRL